MAIPGFNPSFGSTLLPNVALTSINPSRTVEIFGPIAFMADEALAGLFTRSDEAQTGDVLWEGTPTKYTLYRMKEGATNARLATSWEEAQPLDKDLDLNTVSRNAVQADAIAAKFREIPQWARGGTFTGQVFDPGVNPYVLYPSAEDQFYQLPAAPTFIASEDTGRYVWVQNLSPDVSFEMRVSDAANSINFRGASVSAITIPPRSVAWFYQLGGGYWANVVSSGVDDGLLDRVATLEGYRRAEDIPGGSNAAPEQIFGQIETTKPFHSLSSVSVEADHITFAFVGEGPWWGQIKVGDAWRPIFTENNADGGAVARALLVSGVTGFRMWDPGGVSPLENFSAATLIYDWEDTTTQDRLLDSGPINVAPAFSDDASSFAEITMPAALRAGDIVFYEYNYDDREATAGAGVAVVRPLRVFRYIPWDAEHRISVAWEATKPKVIKFAATFRNQTIRIRRVQVLRKDDVARDRFVSLTQTEYDALTDGQKNDATRLYLIQ